MSWKIAHKKRTTSHTQPAKYITTFTNFVCLIPLHNNKKVPAYRTKILNFYIMLIRLLINLCWNKLTPNSKTVKFIDQGNCHHSFKQYIFMYSTFLKTKLFYIHGIPYLCLQGKLIAIVEYLFILMYTKSMIGMF